MFARLATTLAVGRRSAWRPSGLTNRDEVHRTAPSARGRRVLVCRWTLDPVSSRPICAWQAEETGLPALDAPPIAPPVLAFAASDGDPSRRHAIANAQAELRPAAACARRRPALASR